MGYSRPLFIFSFSISFDNKQILNVNFADDWIWTADLWFQKRPLYQLCHNQGLHCYKLQK